MNEQTNDINKNVQPEEHKCQCGCGGDTTQKADGTYSKYIKGHQFKNRGAIKANPELRAPEATEEEPPQQPAAESQKLVVTDLRDYNTDDVAWFQVDEGKYTYLLIDYIGQINGGAYSVLVRTPQGVFLPPYLISGFVGLASVDTQPEPQQKEPEPIPEPVAPEIEEERFEHITSKQVAEKPPSIIDKLKNIGKKEVPKPENPKVSGQNLAEMLKKV